MTRVIPLTDKVGKGGAVEAGRQNEERDEAFDRFGVKSERRLAPCTKAGFHI